jgi:drug/metabolite transporter (DMT)-like permease
MNQKKDKIKSLILLHLLLFACSLGGICSKNAGMQPFLSMKFFLFYGLVLGILFFYAIMWQQILKRLPLVTAYANKAVSIIWGFVWGSIFFDEKIGIMQMIGAVIVIVGVYLVVSSDGKQEEV